MIKNVLGFALYYGIGMGIALTLLGSVVTGAATDRTGRHEAAIQARPAVLTSWEVDRAGNPTGCPYLTRMEASSGCPYLAAMAAAGCPGLERDTGEPSRPRTRSVPPDRAGEEPTLRPRLVASVELGASSQDDSPAPPA